MTWNEEGEKNIIFPAIFLHLLSMSVRYQVNIYPVLDTTLLVFHEQVRHNHSPIEDMALAESVHCSPSVEPKKWKTSLRAFLLGWRIADRHVLTFAISECDPFHRKGAVCVVGFSKGT